MDKNETPAGVGSNDLLGRLLPCPLCGADKGYTLGEGSTYRWWSVQCGACGQEVAEARATYPAETTPRTARADAAWNESGSHANGLRAKVAELEAAEKECMRLQGLLAAAYADILRAAQKA